MQIYGRGLNYNLVRKGVCRMTDVAPRCPFCANVIRVEPTFWSRLGLKPARAVCTACQRECAARDAQTMGASYFHWAEHFRMQLTEALEKAPILSESAIVRAMGNPNKDDVRLMGSLEELVRACLRHQRVAVFEMARGSEAALEVVHLRNEATAAVETVAVLGTSSSESGAKEFEQIVARSDASHYVLYTYPAAQGAEPRVKRAVHGSEDSLRIATQPKAMRMRARRGPAAMPQHTTL
jgi:hypothetical protein